MKNFYYFLLRGLQGSNIFLRYHFTTFLLILFPLFIVACGSGGGGTQFSQPPNLLGECQTSSDPDRLSFISSWNDRINLDLVVTTPSGTRRNSEVDDQDGFDVEVVCLIKPPIGHYTVSFINHDSGSAAYQVNVRGVSDFHSYYGTASPCYSRPCPLINVAIVTHRGIEVCGYPGVNNRYSSIETRCLNSGRSTHTQYTANTTKKVRLYSGLPWDKDLNERPIYNISTIKINTTMSDSEVVIYGTLINGSLMNGTLESLD